MAGEADIWQPRTIIQALGNTQSIEEKQVAIANQNLFVLSTFAYSVGTGALEVYKNGSRLTRDVDFVEQTSTSFSLSTPATAGDVILAQGFVGISGSVGVGVTDIYVNNYQAIRDYVGAQTTLFAKGSVVPGDFGTSFFTYVTGGSIGQYVDDNFFTIVPTGGNGSSAWLRQWDFSKGFVVSNKTNLTALLDALSDAGKLTSAAGHSIFVTSNDGGAFTIKTGIAGTYANDGGNYCGTKNIPTGGNGSVAAVRTDFSSVDLRWFGAVGDLVTDDSVAFNLAKATGYSVLVQKDLIFTISGQSITTPNQRFYGGGTLRLKNAANTTLLTITADSVLLENIIIDGNQSNQTAGAGACVFINTANKVKILHCELKNARGSSILATASSHLVIRSNECHESLGDGIVIQNASNRNWIVDNHVYANGGNGIHIAYGGSSCNYNTVSGNTVENSGVGGASFESGIRTTFATYTKIIGNTCVENAIGAGILTTNSAGAGTGSINAIITGNVCNNNFDGIIADSYSNYAIIESNECALNTQDGIDINASVHCTVRGNVCAGNGQKGLLSWGATYSSILNNIIINSNTSGTTSTDSGISIQKHPTLLIESAYLLIQGNICRDNQGVKTQDAGCRVQDASTNIRIIDNEFVENKTYGIRIVDTASVLSRANTGSISDGSALPSRNPKIYDEDYGGVLTINGGAITVTHRYHAVDTEGLAATDDLTTILGASRIGQKVTLVANNSARTVVCKDGVVNLQLPADFSLDNSQDTITLVWNDANWLQCSNADNGL